MRRAIQTPIRQIVENAGVEASIIVGKLLEQKSNTYGFDAQTEKYVDLVEAGIVDPTKVVRSALQNAASVAGLLITTEAMVADRPKKDSARDAGRRRRHGRHGRHGLLTGRAAPPGLSSRKARTRLSGIQSNTKKQKGRSNPALFFCPVAFWGTRDASVVVSKFATLSISGSKRTSKPKRHWESISC